MSVESVLEYIPASSSVEDVVAPPSCEDVDRVDAFRSLWGKGVKQVHRRARVR